MAPGWISIPVLLCAYSVIIRGIKRTPSLNSSWAIRNTVTAESAGVAEQDLIEILGGRISLEGRVHIVGQASF